LAGSRGANPAFGQVLERAESAVPTVPFAVTYAIASVLLALLGPLLIELV
jgi:putative transport protein